MKLKKLVITMVIFIATSVLVAIAYAFYSYNQKVREFVFGFSNEPASDVQLNINFYDQLYAFARSERLSRNQLSYLFSLLDVNGENAKYRFKGDIYPDLGITVSNRGIYMKGNGISFSLEESIHLVNSNNDEEAIEVFSSPVEDICSLSMILYKDNQATYLTTQDSFGIYLSKHENASLCERNENTQINLIPSLPINIKDKDIEKAKKLADFLNKIKEENQLSNTDIGKIIAMSTLQGEELNYASPYKVNTLTIFNNGYQIMKNDIQEKVWNPPTDNPYIAFFSTNSNNQTSLLDTVELTKYNDLKLVVYKQETAYLYDVNRMKSKRVVGE